MVSFDMSMDLELFTLPGVVHYYCRCHRSRFWPLLFIHIRVVEYQVLKNYLDLQEQKLIGKKNPRARPLGMNIIVKPQKKAKTDMANAEESMDAVKSHVDTDKSFIDLVKPPSVDGDESHVVGNTGLVSYSDESEDE